MRRRYELESVQELVIRAAEVIRSSHQYLRDFEQKRLERLDELRQFQVWVPRWQVNTARARAGVIAERGLTITRPETGAQSRRPKAAGEELAP